MNKVERRHNSFYSRRSKPEYIGLGVLESSDWRECAKKVQYLAPEVLPNREPVKQLGGALRVSDISNLCLTSSFADEIDLSGRIIVSQFSEAELPVLMAFFGIKRLVPWH